MLGRFGRSWRCYLMPIFLLVAASCCVYLLYAYSTSTFTAEPYRSKSISFHAHLDTFRKSRQPSHTQGLCPEGLRGMLQGHWEPVAMTADDVRRMNKFTTDVRQGQFNLPKGLQRNDRRCNNVTFDPRPGLHTDWFRALCDPEGATPCCDSSNTCVAKTVEACRCDGCLDMRTELHAEYATWRTTQPGCQPRNMTAGELCDHLDGGTFFFMGDSLVKHVYIAMLMTIRDNDDTGAFGEGMPKEIQEQCKNLYMFPGHNCRLDVDRVIQACNDRVLIRQINSIYNSHGPAIRSEIIKLKNKTRSVVFIGVGLHGNLDAKDTFEKVMQPLLEQMRTENWRWPLIVWASVHCFGPLKSPNMNGQLRADVIRFNRQTEEFFAPYSASLPLYVFNTFNLTAPVTSYDGAHFALGVNKMKVKVLVNFIRHLRDQGLW